MRFLLTVTFMIEDSRAKAPEPSLIPLFAWLSPAYPVGSYAYSHGLEWAVESGDVSDEASLVDWLRDLLKLGAGCTDAVTLSHAYRAIEAGSSEGFVQVNELALALAPSAELFLETSQQGRSFMDATLGAWPTLRLPRIEGEIAYPVALGAAAAAHGIPLPIALCGFLFALTQNMVSAAIRLAPIGQTTGTRVCALLLKDIEAVAHLAEQAALDDISTGTFRVDLGSFMHETQYSRIFRS
jgi:urease accessory protein